MIFFRVAKWLLKIILEKNEENQFLNANNVFDK